MVILGVIGCGYVGSALAKYFAQKHTVLVNDVEPSRSMTNKERLMCDCGIIFVCVPTPVRDGKYDLAILNDVMGTLDELQKTVKNQPLIVLKSTVPPFTTEEYRANTCLRIAYNPEFLTAKNADRDMQSPDRIVIGSDNFDDQKLLDKLYYSIFQPQPRDSAAVPINRVNPLVFIMSSVEAELVKLLSNAFLVWKVAFSQAAKEICGLYDADAEKVLHAVGADKRIGMSHLNPSLGKIPEESPCLHKDFRGLVGSLRDCEDASAGLFGFLELVRCYGLE